MSLHRLSAGSGYLYLLRHTASGDVARLAGTPLTAYYAASGYPPGRWAGSGLAGIGVPAAEPTASAATCAPVTALNRPGEGRLAAGSVVTEEAMGRLFGRGEDPVTGDRLGARYLVHRGTEQRIQDRVSRLPDDLPSAHRSVAVAAIEAEERRRHTPAAVAGFDLTFTMPKSASVLWALAPPGLQARIAAAHGDTVADLLAMLERDVLFTRTGHGGIAQITTRGAVAACFDHWDTRAGDPNLHTHLVLANKVQGEDGRWRSLDSRALHHAAVALSELYDDLLADRLARVVGVAWGWRGRGPRRTPAFEIDGIDDPILAEFSTRSQHIQARTRDLVAAHRVTHGRTPGRDEVLRLRQQATLATRPEKQLRPLPELITDWRRRAGTHGRRDQLVARAVGRRPRLHTADDIPDEQLRRLAVATVGGLQDRRSTWNPWNVRAEAARATRGLRMASTADRLALLDRVTCHVLDHHSVRLDPPALFDLPAEWRRPDGASTFTRHRETTYTSPAILDAEQRLLAAATDRSGPRAGAAADRATGPGETDALHEDQAVAVTAVVTSGRWVDVLVGPAGAGKTRTLRAVRAAWEATHGPASVIGLAPSATSAHELTAATGIGCETTAKWAHENSAAHGGEQARSGWRLRAGQLVLVDEASLAGTLTLDQLATHAHRAGAKLLLVGDHHQLAAIHAGGGFALLARDTGAAELTALWRFTNRWEAIASRALRHADRRALDAYAAHGRLHEGPAEAMVEDAYQAWRQALAEGGRAVLVAADNDTVAALNARAQADLIAAGQVSLTEAVALHDGTRAGVGDRVVTRTNDRRLRTTRGSWVRNGDLWTVQLVHSDGSLTVHRLHRLHRLHRHDDATRLPARYVRADVELGYATTVHRAQGVTADAAIALVRPGMSRQALYVALTRGRTSNHAYVATDLPDPDHPDPAEPWRAGRQILEAALARSDAELSATETLRARQDQAASLATLVPIHETIAQAAHRQRWAARLHDSGLDQQAVDGILDSPACGALVAALRASEAAGHNMVAALRHLATTVSEATDGGEPELAGLIHDRVTGWLEDAASAGDDGPLLAGLVPAAGPVHDPELARTLAEIEILITGRVHRLVQDVLRRPPTWARSLGPPPREAAARRAWLHAIGVVAAYRDLNQIQDDHTLGNTPAVDVTGERRRATSALATASRLATAHSPRPWATPCTDPAPDRSLRR